MARKKIDPEHQIFGEAEERLTQRKLDALLDVSKGQVRVKSVSSPFAQTVIQCVAPGDREWSYDTMKARYSQIAELDERAAVIFDLQFAGGCRISEVLNVEASDIDGFGKVTIRGLKGGDTRIVASTFSVQYLLQCAQLKVKPFEGINRFYMYRVYSKVGISEKYGSNKRASVTHLPRHEVALASKKINRKEDVTRDQLGQKSTKSTAHYTHKKRG